MAFRILFIETKASVYGGQKALLARCGVLKQRGISFTIIHPFVDSAFSRQAIDAGLANHLRRPPLSAIGASKMTQSAFILAELTRQVHDGRIDVIHTDAFDSAYLVAGLRRLGRLKQVFCVFTLRSERYRRFNVIDRLLLRQLDHLCTNSQFSRGEIHRATGIPLADITVTYTPIDFTALPGRSRPAPEQPGRLVIGYMGSIEPRKRLDRFIDYGRRLQRELADRCRIELQVYGTAKQAGAATLPVHKTHADTQHEPIIHYAGYATPTDAAAAIDILFCPFDDEPLGRVVVEYLYLGVPVIAMNAGGLPEAGCGYARLVEGNDEDTRYAAFAAHVRALRAGDEAPGDTNAIQEHLVARFSADRVVERELVVYAQHRSR